MVIVTHKQADRHTVLTGRDSYRQDERRCELYYTSEALETFYIAYTAPASEEGAVWWNGSFTQAKDRTVIVTVQVERPDKFREPRFFAKCSL